MAKKVVTTKISKAWALKTSVPVARKKKLRPSGHVTLRNLECPRMSANAEGDVERVRSYGAIPLSPRRQSKKKKSIDKAGLSRYTD